MNNKIIILLIIAVLAGGAGGYWLANGSSDSAKTGSTAAQTERKPLFYRNPMKPEITSPVPAQDQMGMDYIPVYADDAQDSAPAGTVRIDPVTVQNIGVRTALAERRSMSHSIQTVGRIGYDEKRLYELHPKTEGWVEQLFIDTTGAPVKKETILLSFYSPQLVSTQQEYVLALKNLETLQASGFEDVRRGAEELVATTLERLRLLDVPEHQIRNLAETLEVKKNLHIHSPAKGIVTSIGARQGQYVTPQTKLYTIADLSKVWVYIDIYEDELPWVTVGDKATIDVAALPGQRFEGVLSYIYPYAESKTRTIKVRMVFDNPDGLLKPDMFANVVIETSALPDAIVIPSEAIVRSGSREQVFVQRAPGKFEPRDVNIGVSSKGWTEVKSGIAAGDKIVISAQFLIDSESKLREAASKMRETRND
ncbi:MAG: efflux RND transporter periplasmic adaptor subunit [Xanthomonadales bacterium]|nr:efflux RND transporter periplasmic adaptor subunit [Xanthomonadales bacterium]